MFFRNLFLYRMHPDTAEDLKRITFELESHALRDVGPMEMGTFGSVAPLGASIEDAFTHTVGDCILFARGQNEKLLPAAVVNDEVQRKVQQIAEEEGRKVGGRERRRIKEDTLSLLLPRAFVRHSRTRAYADVKRGWIVIDTPTAKHAEHVVTLVREALGSFPVVPLAPEEGPRVLMTDWLASGNLPDGFALGDECLLRDPATSSGAIAKCSRQELDSEEVKEHLRNGKQVFQLGLVYDDRISFVLGEDLVVRKLRFLDLVTDELGDGHEDTLSLYDAQFALMTLELQRLLSAFEQIFGLKVDAPLHMQKQDAPEGMVPDTKPVGLGTEDPLYAQAVDFVRASGKASISALQRGLKIGYNRSAWLIESMAEAGVISQADKSGSRHVITHGPRNDKAPGNVRRRKALSAPP